MSATAQSRVDPFVLPGNSVPHPRGLQVPFSERRAMLILVDGLVVLFAVWAAILLSAQVMDRHWGVAHGDALWLWFPVLLASWWALAALNDLYDVPSSVNRRLTVVRVAVAGALGVLIYSVIARLAPHNLHEALPMCFLLIALPAIILWRWTYALLLNTAHFRHAILILGAGERAQATANMLKHASELNCCVLGYVDLDPPTEATAMDGLPLLGRATDLPRLVAQLEPREIVVATDRQVDENLLQLLFECHGLGVQVSHTRQLHEELQRSIPIQHIDPAWALGIMERLPRPLELAVKRMLDVFLGAIGLLILILISPLLALAIYLDSPGPILYRQIRCGRGSRPFSIVKFRTMTPDAEQDGVARWASTHDRRITRVGRILRKMRLDELPQVFNVLRGEMSVVGPRPERPEFVTELAQKIPFYRSRLMVKPGLTGWAQIHYPYGNSVQDAIVKLEYDSYYLGHWSLWLDLYVIFRTCSVVLRFKGT
jgi:exopolysaccharide biosynthesis polyprenyl glycosylphosphotransferase